MTGGGISKTIIGKYHLSVHLLNHHLHWKLTTTTTITLGKDVLTFGKETSLPRKQAHILWDWVEDPGRPFVNLFGALLTIKPRERWYTAALPVHRMAKMIWNCRLHSLQGLLGNCFLWTKTACITVKRGRRLEKTSKGEFFFFKRESQAGTKNII